MVASGLTIRMDQRAHERTHPAAGRSSGPPNHIFFFSHGWQGDVPAAIAQYNRWIKALTDLPADMATIGADFKPLWIGLHWPSLPWGDDEARQ